MACIAYNLCYVWDDYNIGLYKLLRTKSDFIVECPDSLKIDQEQYLYEADYKDVKYFLGRFNDYQLKNIATIMRKIG